jgi:hypothetical protein
MPTASDLVTDLPADFETFGQAVATSMADLLGGTTGQVLSKASNTDMDFTWVTSDDANAIQNAIVDAKGDLIAASAADTPARLAVGNNGETLVADSSTSTGLRYQSGYNGNAIINGGMDIWQRGTSFSSFVAVYTADRWLNWRSGNAQGQTISRQSSGLTGIQYSMRTQRDSGSALTQDIYNTYALESADSYRFAGQTVTFSFYAKVGANFSGASSNGIAFLYSGTGTDQNLFSGFTGRVTVGSSTPALTTSWQRFTITGTVASNATQMGLLVGYVPTGTAGANDWIEVTGVQLELGSVATNFKRAGGTLQGELAACQRYYFRQNATQVYSTFGQGSADTTTANMSLVNLPVVMRVAPTSMDFSTLANYDGQTVTAVTTAALGLSLQSQSVAYVAATVASGLTQYRPYKLIANNSTSAFIGFNAEL